MKKCSQCGVDKEISEFYKDIRTKTGTYSSCKKCHLKSLPYISAINFTKKDLLSYRWIGIKNRHRFPLYRNIKVIITRDEFFKKFDNSDLDKLFKKWIESGKQHTLVPSIDRINPDGDYEASNMRWVTLSQNAQYARKLGHRRKKIYQVSKDGNILMCHASLKDAAQSVGSTSKGVSNISAVLRGRTKTAYGFMWKYAT